MNKWEMREYIEKNFGKIIEDHFKVLGQELMYPDSSLTNVLKNLDSLNFYKAWKESPDFKATVFLEEIEGDGEDKKDSKGTEL